MKKINKKSDTHDVSAETMIFRQVSSIFPSFGISTWLNRTQLEKLFARWRNFRLLLRKTENKKVNETLLLLVILARYNGK